MSEENKTISRRVVEEIFNQGKLEVADVLIAPNAVSHDPAVPEPPTGPEGVKQLVAGYRNAFPDVHIVIDDEIAAGDRVVTRWTARGTHDGDFLGIAPTGKQVTVTGITIDKIAGGKLVESWTNWDTLGLMQQIGVVPVQATA